MSTCTKYKVIRVERRDVPNAQHLQDWLNDLYKHHGYSLVAIDEDYYIFSRNAFLSDIKREEETK